MLIPINPLDNLLTVFEKVIDFQKSLRYLKNESGRYVSENGRSFVISLDKFDAFIAINFAMEYYNLHYLRLYRKTRKPSALPSYVANTYKGEIKVNSRQSTFL